MENTIIEKVKSFIDEDGHIDLAWALGTSDEYMITEYFKEDNDGEEPNDGDWDVINDSIENFESTYRSILEEFVSGGSRNEGHDSDNDLVGSCWATLREVVEIINGGESNSHGEIIFNTSSGSLSCEEVDLLEGCVNAHLLFFIPEDLFDLLDAMSFAEQNALVAELEAEGENE